jgi:hypothetical protein
VQDTKRRVFKRVKIRSGRFSDKEMAISQSAHLHFSPCVQGGESKALERLHCYLWGSDKVATYFDTVRGS